MDEKNLFSIGEMARALDVTRRIILNYEEKGLIYPDKKDGEAGNRYYTVDTMTKARTVRILQKQGLSLTEIRAYLDGQTDLLSLIRRLEKMRDEINLNIEKLYERVDTDRSAEHVRHIRIEAQTVYRRVYCTDSIAEKTDLLRKTALEAIRQYGTDTTKRLYFTEYAYNEPSKVSFCVAVPSESCGEYIEKLPRVDALCIYYHGGYENLGEISKRLYHYAQERGISTRGIIRHIYLEGPPQHADKSQFITHAALLVENR